ncbi:hypothetical protein [Kurthia senegalensis]|uniref:hypothetical protein n=1 Tax=Kurthia senegalensis TaxID=1033740 RepID=UPI0002888BB6|nr:hypothetical protein [Kurthia senegalensis]
MNINKLACYFLPAFAMLAIAILAKEGLLGDTTEANAEYVIFGLYLLFPILFLYQGFACSLKRYPWIHAVIISVLAFVAMVLLLKLESFVYTYILYYLVAFIIGYVLTAVIRKARTK